MILKLEISNCLYLVLQKFLHTEAMHSREKRGSEKLAFFLVTKTVRRQRKRRNEGRLNPQALSLAGSFNKEVTRLYSFWGIPETDWIRGVFELVDSVF